MDDESTLSTSVLSAVAAREGVDPAELSDPLYSVVDTELLDRLFTNGTGHVTFEYMEYEVTVHSSGDVDLDPCADE